MKATADAIPMQPDIAYQASPHTTVAELAGPGKVIAKWCEPDGTDSGLAAATATSAGVFLGHVWFDASGKNVKQFLLSLVNYLAPDIWKKSAANWLEAIGVIENYTGLEDIRSKFAKDASMEAKSALAAAFELREKARGALAEARWVECIKLCEDAQNKVIEALCRQVKPVEGEQRGFWCHSAFGLPGNNWDESIKFLVDNGFNTILPNMLWGGMAYYKSDVLPTYANYAKQGDQVRQCLDACKKYGVKCHVWKVNWNMGSHLDKAFVEKMKAEKRTQVLFNGEQKDTWLCPSNPLNRRQEADAMLELVRNYPDLDAGICQSEARVAILHRNVPNMISQISSFFGRNGLNIEHLASKSKGKYEYTLIDLGHPMPHDTAEKLLEIDGVLRVRRVSERGQ